MLSFRKPPAWILRDEHLGEKRDMDKVSTSTSTTNITNTATTTPTPPPQNLYTTPHLSLRQCCMSLHACSDPLGPVEYKLGLLNPSPFPLFPCPCLSSLLSCLSSLPSEEGPRLASVWAQYGGHCYTTHTHTR